MLTLDVDDYVLDQYEQAILDINERCGVRHVSVSDHLRDAEQCRKVEEKKPALDPDSEEEFRSRHAHGDRRRHHDAFDGDVHGHRCEYRDHGHVHARRCERTDSPAPAHPVHHGGVVPEFDMSPGRRGAGSRESSRGRRPFSARRSPVRRSQSMDAVGALHLGTPPSGNPAPKSRARHSVSALGQVSPRVVNFPPMGHSTSSRLA